MAYVAGRVSSRAIRAALVGVGRQLRNTKLTAAQTLKLLEHQLRLSEELKAIAVEVLERRIARADKTDKGDSAT